MPTTVESNIKAKIKSNTLIRVVIDTLEKHGNPLFIRATLFHFQEKYEKYSPIVPHTRHFRKITISVKSMLATTEVIETNLTISSN